MLDAGVPLVYIRNFLGHESVSTTERHARVSQSTMNRVLEKHSIASTITVKDRGGIQFERANETAFFPDG